MKLTSLSTLLVAIFLYGCSSNKSESGKADSTAIVKDTLASTSAADASHSLSAEKQLDNFLLEFNSLAETSQKIVFRGEYELTNTSSTCHFVDGKLRFFYIDERGEGEEDYTWLRTQPGKESVVKISSTTLNFYKQVTGEEVQWFNIKRDGSTGAPVIVQDPMDGGQILDNAEPRLKELLNMIIKNKSKFVLDNELNLYQWTIKDEQIESQLGGQVRIFETITIDPSLFNLDWNSFITQ